MSRLKITRREFLASATAASALEVSVPTLARADPPNPDLQVTPKAEVADLGVGEIIVRWEPYSPSCVYELTLTGPLLDGVTQTQTFANVAPGFMVANLPSRARFLVSVRARCGEATGDWSAPVAFSTRLPTPAAPGVAPLALGAAEVRWSLTFPRPVIDRTGLVMRVIRTRGVVATVVAELTGEIENGKVIDASFGPGDQYQLQVWGKYLSHPSVDDYSPLSEVASAGVAYQAIRSSRLLEQPHLLPAEVNVFSAQMWNLF